MILKQLLQAVPSHQRAQVARELSELAKKKQEKSQNLDFSPTDLLEFTISGEPTQEEIDEVYRLL